MENKLKNIVKVFNDRKEEVEEKELHEVFIDEINGGINPDALAKGIANSHRALQQRAFDDLIKPTIIKLADNHSDRRNNRAVSGCKEIVDTMDW
jgi:hypothetical protein